MIDAASPPEDDSDDRIREAVRAIGEHARRANLERAARLAEALTAAGGHGLDDAGRVAAADIAHQLVGSAGTFGFRDVSQLAVELEKFFSAGPVGDRHRLAYARRQLGMIEAQLAGHPGDQRTA